MFLERLASKVNSKLFKFLIDTSRASPTRCLKRGLKTHRDRVGHVGYRARKSESVNAQDTARSQ